MIFLLVKNKEDSLRLLRWKLFLLVMGIVCKMHLEKRIYKMPTKRVGIRRALNYIRFF